MTIDRSFAAAPPPCVETLMAPKVSGESWGSAVTNLASEVRARDICLAEVEAWLESERQARSGKPGA
ncbi:MAG: hypothetical protein ACRCU1_05685 [Alsobacter sp.]